MKHVQETEDIVDVDCSEEFSSTTTQQEVLNPQIVHSPDVSAEQENIDVDVYSTADITHIQNCVTDNESLGEESSATGKVFISIK